MPSPLRPSELDTEAPLIGRFVSGLIKSSSVAAVSWLVWQASAGAVIASAGLAILSGALWAALWLGFFSHADPEPRIVHWIAVPGRVLLLIELILIVCGGLALWIVWHRAAGETYWTLAAIHIAVRYSRVAALWRSHDALA